MKTRYWIALVVISIVTPVILSEIGVWNKDDKYMEKLCSRPNLDKATEELCKQWRESK